jgi:hypothetical protein
MSRDPNGELVWPEWGVIAAVCVLLFLVLLAVFGL